jgi:hypothetical protein
MAGISAETSQDIAKDWEQHRAKVESGAIVSANGRLVRISENIDRSMKRDLESFLNTAVTADGFVSTTQHTAAGL